MPRNGWFHSHNQNFDAENGAHRKIDGYSRTEPRRLIKIVYFLTKLKNDNRLNKG